MNYLGQFFQELIQGILGAIFGGVFESIRDRVEKNHSHDHCPECSSHSIDRQEKFFGSFARGIAGVFLGVAVAANLICGLAGAGGIIKAFSEDDWGGAVKIFIILFMIFGIGSLISAGSSYLLWRYLVTLPPSSCRQCGYKWVR